MCRISPPAPPPQKAKNKPRRNLKNSCGAICLSVLESGDLAADDAALRSLDEVYDLADDVGLLKLGLDVLESLSGVHLAEVEATVNLLGLSDLLGSVAVTLETYNVEALESSGLATDHSERGYILAEAGATLDHNVATDTGELMAERATTDNCEIRALHLASELASVGNNDVVAENTVMAEVAVCHDEVVAAKDSLTPRSSATIDGSALADGVVVANLASGLLALELEVLRDATDYGVLRNAVVLAHTGAPTYSGAIEDFATITNDNIVLDDGEGANLYVVAYLCARVDTGEGAYFAIAWIAHNILCSV